MYYNLQIANLHNGIGSLFASAVFKNANRVGALEL